MSETVTFLSLKGKETCRQEVPEGIPKAEVRGVWMVSRRCSKLFEKLVDSNCVMVSFCLRQKCLTSDHKQLVDYFRLIFRAFVYSNIKLVLLPCTIWALRTTTRSTELLKTVQAWGKLWQPPSYFSCSRKLNKFNDHRGRVSDFIMNVIIHSWSLIIFYQPVINLLLIALISKRKNEIRPWLQIVA